MIVRLLLSVLLCTLLPSCVPDPAVLEKTSSDTGRQPVITPDYAGTVLPPNIAPANFRIRERGNRFLVNISAPQGAPVVVLSRNGSIVIPEKKWHSLLGANHGGTLRITVYARGEGASWQRFSPVEIRIAEETIDPYLTYRTLSFLYNYSSDLRLHERHLESFRERTLLSTKNFYWGCVNCHTPECNDPGRTVVHYRSNDFGNGTILATDGTLKKIGSRLSYTSWRPGGKYIAFSQSRVRQCFHSTGRNPIDDYDLSSELFVYDVAREKFLDVPALYRQRMIQSWPAWSPDGQYLYFCSGPVVWDDYNKVPPDRYDELRCSLLRMPFNEAGRSFGAIDTVLSPDATGLSVSQPRVSPDGRFVLFCMHDYGPYPVTQPSSDLYLLELATGNYRRLELSSNESESWHGWSKNGRWIVFSSKRNGGILTRLYFASIDSMGKPGKPFILPQKDPAFYESYIRCFNVPELAVAAAPFSSRDLIRVIKSPEAIQAVLPKKQEPAIRENPSAEWSTLKASAE